MAARSAAVRALSSAAHLRGRGPSSRTRCAAGPRYPRPGGQDRAEVFPA